MFCGWIVLGPYHIKVHFSRVGVVDGDWGRGGVDCIIILLSVVQNFVQ